MKSGGGKFAFAQFLISERRPGGDKISAKETQINLPSMPRNVKIIRRNRRCICPARENGEYSSKVKSILDSPKAGMNYLHLGGLILLMEWKKPPKRKTGFRDICAHWKVLFAHVEI